LFDLSVLSHHVLNLLLSDDGLVLALLLLKLFSLVELLKFLLCFSVPLEEVFPLLLLNLLVLELGLRDHSFFRDALLLADSALLDLLLLEVACTLNILLFHNGAFIGQLLFLGCVDGIDMLLELDRGTLTLFFPPLQVLFFLELALISFLSSDCILAVSFLTLLFLDHFVTLDDGLALLLCESRLLQCFNLSHAFDFLALNGFLLLDGVLFRVTLHDGLTGKFLFEHLLDLLLLLDPNLGNLFLLHFDHG